MSGHLFLTRGDVTGLACDAVLIPSGTQPGTDTPGFVEDHWTMVLGDLARGSFLPDPPTADRRVVALRDGAGIQRPALWAGFTGDDEGESLDFYADAVRAFIEAATAAATSRIAAHPDDPRPLADRRPLLAMPLIGSGTGGRGWDKGGLLLGLVAVLLERLAVTDADVVLVLHTPEAYAAAQRARQQVGGAWGDLDDGLEAAAVRLAERARAQELVVFLGAGASIGAGLLSWSDLLAALGRRAELGDELDAFTRLDPRDAGLILTQQLGRAGLREAVVELSRARRSSIVHQLVASLPVREAVTTNYDTLFEAAWRATGRAPNVLPPGPLVLDEPWLLKLHGSVDRPDRIVLSRDDYLRFEEEGVALAGIVQALLLTRHMLFVGYSLSDDNFHRLVHQVRSAIDPAEHGGAVPEPFGTALTPRRTKLGDRLWRGQVRFVTTAGERDDDPRRAAIVLDRVGALAAAPAAHVLSPAYDRLLSDGQRELRTALSSVWSVVDSGRLDVVTRDAVAAALERIGRPGSR